MEGELLHDDPVAGGRPLKELPEAMDSPLRQYVLPTPYPFAARAVEKMTDVLRLAELPDPGFARATDEHGLDFLDSASAFVVVAIVHPCAAPQAAQCGEQEVAALFTDRVVHCDRHFRFPIT